MKGSKGNGISRFGFSFRPSGGKILVLKKYTWHDSKQTRKFYVLYYIPNKISVFKIFMFHYLVLLSQGKL